MYRKQSFFPKLCLFLLKFYFTPFLLIFLFNFFFPFLQLMYLNDTKALIPHYMNIPNCGTPCLLKNLMKLWKNVLPDNWDNECSHS